MKSCSRLIAFGFVLLFLLSAPISLAMLNLDNYLMTPEPYLRALQEESFATQLPEIAAEQIRYSMTYDPCLDDPRNCEAETGDVPAGEGAQDGPPAYLRSLTHDQWKTILGILLEPGWLETQSQTLLTGFFANLEPGNAPVPIVISLDEIKSNLVGTQGITLIEQLLAAQPPCTSAQLLDLAAASLSLPDLSRLLSCNPPPEVMTIIIPELRAALRQAAGEIPHTISVDILNTIFTGSPGAKIEGEPALVRARVLMRFSPFVPLALLLMIGLFAVRSLRDLGLWIGVPLLITGAGMVAVGWLAPGVVDWAVERFIVPALPGMLSPVTGRFVLDMILRVGKLTASRVAFQSLIILVVGSVMLVIGLLVRPKRRVDSIAPLTKPRGGANEGQ